MSTHDPRWDRASYADGELDPAARERLAAALAQDATAAAEVERWRALRRCSYRVLASTPVPAGLAERVRARLAGGAAPAANTPTTRGEQQPRAKLSRTYRLGLSSLAAAAVLTLVFLYYPRGARATPMAVEASSFAHVHEHCAMHHLHDGMDVQHASDNPLEYIRKRSHLAWRMPDLTECGDFKVVAACRCSPVPSLQTVHIVFRCSKSQRLVSVFAADRDVVLVSNGRRCHHCKGGGRDYTTGQAANVQLIGWNENGHGYVLAAQAEPNELRRLADGAKLASVEGDGRSCGRVLAQSGEEHRRPAGARTPDRE